MHRNDLSLIVKTSEKSPRRVPPEPPSCGTWHTFAPLHPRSVPLPPSYILITTVIDTTILKNHAVKAHDPVGTLLQNIYLYGCLTINIKLAHTSIVEPNHFLIAVTS